MSNFNFLTSLLGVNQDQSKKEGKRADDQEEKVEQEQERKREQEEFKWEDEEEEVKEDAKIITEKALQLKFFSMMTGE